MSAPVSAPVPAQAVPKKTNEKKTALRGVRGAAVGSRASEPPASLEDKSAVSATAAAADFGDDLEPPPRDDGEEDGMARSGTDADAGFSRLLEWRSREELFLACPGAWEETCGRSSTVAR